MYLRFYKSLRKSKNGLTDIFTQLVLPLVREHTIKDKSYWSQSVSKMLHFVNILIRILEKSSHELSSF